MYIHKLTLLLLLLPNTVQDHECIMYWDYLCDYL